MQIAFILTNNHEFYDPIQPTQLNPKQTQLNNKLDSPFRSGAQRTPWSGRNPPTCRTAACGLGGKEGRKSKLRGFFENLGGHKIHSHQRKNNAPIWNKKNDPNYSPEGFKRMSPCFMSALEILVQICCMLEVVWPPPEVLDLQAMDTRPEQSWR